MIGWNTFPTTLSHSYPKALALDCSVISLPTVAPWHPLWFVVDGGELAFNTGKNTAKGRALARDPRVVMCVDDPRPPYSKPRPNRASSGNTLIVWLRAKMPSRDAGSSVDIPSVAGA